MVSAVSRLVCPICRAAIPLFAFGFVTGPWQFRHYICNSCSKTLELYVSTRSKILLAILAALVFFGSAIIGFRLFADLTTLSYYHESRGHRVPNTAGFVIAVFVFVLPATSLSTTVLCQMIGSAKKVELR
jgi:hypothetical protein